MPIKCQLVERTSKEGNRYQALEIELTKGYKKLVFLTPAEKELLMLSNSGNKTI